MEGLLYKVTEDGMGPVGPGLKFGKELDAQMERTSLCLHGFH
jgi:hypothetical protein